MFKVTVKNLQGIVTHGATFDTLPLAQAWIDQTQPTEAWGKLAYTEIIPAVTEWQEVVVQPQVIEQQVVVISPEVLDEQGNVVTPAVTELQDVVVQEEIRQMQEVVVSPEQTIEHQDEFTIEIEDISAQVAAQQRLQQRKDKRTFGENMIDQLAVINETSNVSGAALEALVLDPDFMVVKEFLWDGSLKSAYNKILTIESKILTVFSQPALDQIKAQLLAKLQELGEI